ncbi:MAG: GMC family oxidoreductase N-terminal domain-containing protein [Pseudomonadota bacterium]
MALFTRKTASKFTVSDACYDYIIVGAGSAGCVLANRLSADPSKRVLLLEAGGHDNRFWIKIPVGYLYTIGDPRTDWCFETAPEKGLNGRRIGYARGRVIGGSSSINAMIYMRGQRSDYDGWAALGNKGWGWEDVLPVFKRSESYYRGADAFHGGDGEVYVEAQRCHWEILDAWRDAAAECGLPKIEEFNRGDNFGVAYFQMTQRGGLRWSAADAFLKPARGRPNIDILTDAHVHNILLSEESGPLRANGVLVAINGSTPRRFNASREVVLAAGAVGSPHLLQLSGIGPGDLLQRHGVTLRRDMPGVGANLQDHLQIRSIYKVHHTTTLNRRNRTLFGRALMAMEFALRRTGPLTMPPSQLGAFARSDASQETPNIEWHVQPLSLDKFGEPLHAFDAITPSVCNLRPTSRGFVRLSSPVPAAAPEIAPNYLSTVDDRRVAVDGLRFTRRIMAAESLARFSPTEWKPGPHAVSDEDLLLSAGELGATIFHPVGTCKMGHDDKAVVDDRLALHGVKGLRVIDASIMPTITSGNTNAPTMMIAEKGAAFILEDNR